MDLKTINHLESLSERIRPLEAFDNLLHVFLEKEEGEKVLMLEEVHSHN